MVCTLDISSQKGKKRVSIYIGCFQTPRKRIIDYNITSTIIQRLAIHIKKNELRYHFGVSSQKEKKGGGLYIEYQFLSYNIFFPSFKKVNEKKKRKMKT